MSRPRLMEQLGLQGVIHIWGKAGVGKTLLASKIASNESRFAKVEWINTDAKQSFIPHLRRNIVSENGIIENITVTMVTDRQAIKETIESLNDVLNSDVSLVIIDSITRLLDMARRDPTLWGRELIEEALPTLAGIVSRRGVSVIVTSESRSIDEKKTLAVHYKTIAKWSDYDIQLVRNIHSGSSQIIRCENGDSQIGTLDLLENRVM
ncbi:MAG: NB-ARC domain-containing protein, partial [Candidatus Thorarchaeota archaeon]